MIPKNGSNPTTPSKHAASTDTKKPPRCIRRPPSPRQGHQIEADLPINTEDFPQCAHVTAKWHFYCIA
jgi:hypothetical protein